MSEEIIKVLKNLPFYFALIFTYLLSMSEKPVLFVLCFQFNDKYYDSSARIIRIEHSFIIIDTGDVK